MKIFRLIFSRMFLLVFLILLQVAALTAIVYFMVNNKGYIGGICYAILVVISIIMFVFIINSQSLPDLKIPWISFILGIPILGVLCFVFFSNRGIRKKTKDWLYKIDDKIYKYYTNVSDWDKNLNDEKPEYLGLFNYIRNVNWLNPHEGNNVIYFKSGEEFFPDLIKKLKEAEEFILMEFFIVDYGKEWSQIYEVLCQKAKEGVNVQFMYDDIGCASTLKHSFVKDMESKGIKCCRFNPFVPVLSGVFNNRDHRKICVIDHKYGYTGGINLADEYANDIVRFGYWKDSMIRIEGPSIKNLILMFCITFDTNYRKESDYKALLSGEYPIKGNSLVMPFGDGPAPFCNYNIGEQTFINLFAVARKSIYISSPYLIPTHSMLEALKNAALRGIDVKLVVPGIPDKKLVYLMAKNNFRPLVDCGVKIYTYTPGFNHEKEVIVDNEIAFIGTINLDYRSLIHHFECGAIVYRSKAIDDMVSSFEDTIQKSKLVPNNFKLKFFTRILCSLIALFQPLL